MPRPSRAAAQTAETDGAVVEAHTPTAGQVLRAVLDDLRSRTGEMTEEEFDKLMGAIEGVTNRTVNFTEPEDEEPAQGNGPATLPAPEGVSLIPIVKDHAWSSFEVRQTQKGGPMHDIKIYFDQAIPGALDTAVGMYVDLDARLREEYDRGAGSDE